MRMPSPPAVGEGFHARPARVDGKRGCARKKWCAGCARGIGYVGGRRHRARRIKRGCNRSRRTAAPNPPRQSSGARGVEDAAPYGGCETYADACRVTGAATFSVHRRRAGVEARPYFGLRGLTGNVGARHPPCTNPSVTPLCGATAPLSGEPRRGQWFAAFTHLFTTMRIPTFR